MTAVYAAGKLDATGHARGEFAGDDLSHHCETVSFRDPADRVAYVKIASNKFGVSQISVETVSEPILELNDVEEPSRYGFMNGHWERFVDGRELFGFWGTTDEETGNLNSLGFIGKDGTC